MKLIKKIIIPIILSFMFIPSIVNAASASISVSAASTGVVGNQLKVTVTVSSNQALGGWEFSLGYDKSYLSLSSAPSGANGTSIADYATSSGTKSKSYTYSFKVLKSGNATIRVTDSDVYGWDESNMSVSNGSKTVTLKTQEEIEASYSKDAYLKSITISGYEITPAFNKDTYEYEVEVPNEIELVTINAQKNDANASVNGTGDKNLVEGPNKFEIICTAQKGNSLTYTVTITRKELDPIHVKINNKEYTLVRRVDMLPTDLFGMSETTVKYEDNEIPALTSSITNITIIGVKDEEGTIKMYFFENGKITNSYVELNSTLNGIVPLNIDNNEGFENYITKEIEINGLTIKALVIKEDSKYAVIYGLDVTTNETNYYTYDIKNNTLQLFNKEIDEFYNNKLNLYRYIILGGIAVIIILLLLIVFRKPSKKVPKEKTPEEPKNKKKSKLKDLLYEPDDESVEEVQEIDAKEIVEEIKEKKEQLKKKKTVEDEVDDDTFVKTRKINLDEIAESSNKEEAEEPTELSKKEMKKLAKEEKKRLKQEDKSARKILDGDEF